MSVVRPRDPSARGRDPVCLRRGPPPGSPCAADVTLRRTGIPPRAPDHGVEPAGARRTGHGRHAPRSSQSTRHPRSPGTGHLPRAAPSATVRTASRRSHRTGCRPGAAGGRAGFVTGWSVRGFPGHGAHRDTGSDTPFGAAHRPYDPNGAPHPPLGAGPVRGSLRTGRSPHTGRARSVSVSRSGYGPSWLAGEMSAGAPGRSPAPRWPTLPLAPTQHAAGGAVSGHEDRGGSGVARTPE